MRAFREAYLSEPIKTEEASQAIDTLHGLFVKVEEHWEKAGKEDAEGWARDARGRFGVAQRKMNINDVAYSYNMLEAAQKNCKSCHDVYRPKE